MARPLAQEDDEKPLDPAVERVRRKLVRFVAINVGLLAAALMAVVAALVYKSRAPASSEMLEAEIALPAGARLVSHALDGDRLSLETELPDGGRALIVYDIAERRVVARLAVRAGP